MTLSEYARKYQVDGPLKMQTFFLHGALSNDKQQCPQALVGALCSACVLPFLQMIGGVPIFTHLFSELGSLFWEGSRVAHFKMCHRAIKLWSQTFLKVPTNYWVSTINRSHALY